MPASQHCRLLIAAALLLAVPLGATDHRKAGRSNTPGTAPGTSALAQQMEAILASPPISGSDWGISVTAADGTPLYQHNDDVRLAAASNTKLLTTAAAFALLGPRYTTTTTVVSPTGPPLPDGTLGGDLVLVGSGDTSISARVLPYSQHTERTGDPLAAIDELARQLVRAGVRHVTGNIVGDDTRFASQPWPTGWEWNDLQWEYGAPVSALITNDNVLYLTIAAGLAPGDPATCEWLPQVPHFTLQSSVATVAAAPGARPAIGASRLPGSTAVHLWGTIPVGAQPASMALAVDDPAVFAAQALSQRMLAAGIRVDGQAIAHHRDPHELPATDDAASIAPAAYQQPLPVAATGTVLASRTSPPLLQDLIVTNKVSQNLHAEVMLQQLNPQSRAQALAAERRFLLAAGLLAGDFSLQDGSGLSRDDMVTPRAFTTLLRYASAQPWGAAYKATLPIGGTDGTLSQRFTAAPLKGNVFAKTGSLGQDASLSGYLTAASGRTVIFSILCNRHLPGSAAREAIDRMVAAIAAAE